MSEDKYIAFDVHQATTVVSVVNAAGREVNTAILPTQAQALLGFVEGLRGRLHLTLEEGTYSAWFLSSDQYRSFAGAQDDRSPVLSYDFASWAKRHRCCPGLRRQVLYLPYRQPIHLWEVRRRDSLVTSGPNRVLRPDLRHGSGRLHAPSSLRTAV